MVTCLLRRVRVLIKLSVDDSISIFVQDSQGLSRPQRPPLAGFRSVCDSTEWSEPLRPPSKPSDIWLFGYVHGATLGAIAHSQKKLTLLMRVHASRYDQTTEPYIHNKISYPTSLASDVNDHLPR